MRPAGRGRTSHPRRQVIVRYRSLPATTALSTSRRAVDRRRAPQERDGHPEVFEAAWSPAGAAYLHTPRWSDDVADIVQDCPDHFRGRTSRDRPLAPPEVAQQFPEVLIFDARYVRSADRRMTPR